MSLYGWTCSNVLAPLWEGARGRPTIKYLKSLEATQWLSHDEIAKLQLAKLKKLLVYSHQNIAYYKELFDKIGFDPRAMRSQDELLQIPALTKDIIRERYHDMVDPAHRGLNLKKGTSGSTGMPLKFEYSRDSHAWREAVKMRGYGWGGYRIGYKTLHYWAQVHAPPPGTKGFKLKMDRALKRDTVIDSMKQTEETMRAAAKLIQELKPRVIICYTQSCAQFARFVIEENLRTWDDIPVLCGAEAVLPADRTALAKAFGSGIFETYGSRETMLMASECDAHDGMHLQEENLVVEIVAGKAHAKANESGDVIVTDLHNYGMPFIRYVNGDIAMAAGDKPCACGRGLKKIERVEGRRADTIIDREGKPIPGIIFHVLFSDSRKEVIKQLQVVQKADGEITLFAVRGQDWNDAAFEVLRGRFQEYLRGLPFKVEFVEWIPAGANGKRKTIIVEKRATAAAAEA